MKIDNIAITFYGKTVEQCEIHKVGSRLFGGVPYTQFKVVKNDIEILEFSMLGEDQDINKDVEDVFNFLMEEREHKAIKAKGEAHEQTAHAV